MAKYRFMAKGAPGYPPIDAPAEEVPPQPSVLFPDEQRILQFGPPGGFPAGIYETDSEAEALFLRSRGFAQVDEKGGPAFDPADLPANLKAKWDSLAETLKQDWFSKSLDWVKGRLEGTLDQVKLAQHPGGGFPCPHCNRVFPSQQALAGHMSVHK